MKKRIELNELLEIVREKYDLDPKYYDVTPHVEFGDYGDGVQYENIYFDIQETLEFFKRKIPFVPDTDSAAAASGAACPSWNKETWNCNETNDRCNYCDTAEEDLKRCGVEVICGEKVTLPPLSYTQYLLFNR
jgi:hypothetical protein